MGEYLAVLAAGAAGAEARRAIGSRGRVRQSYGPRVLVFEAAPEVARRLAEHGGVRAIERGAVPSALADDLDETGRMGVAAWNQRHDPAFRAAKGERAGEGMSWDRPPDAGRGGRPER
jgi:hypothetical protein